MKIWTKLFLIIFPSIFSLSAVEADAKLGYETGLGLDSGKAVVCYRDQELKSIKSIELLDMVSARLSDPSTQYDLGDSKLPPSKKLKFLVDRLANYHPLLSEIAKNSFSSLYDEYVDNRVSEDLPLVDGNGQTRDSFGNTQDKCFIEQVAAEYITGTKTYLKVNQRIWNNEFMSNDTRFGLVTYKLLRDNERSFIFESSLRSAAIRELNALYLSGDLNQLTPEQFLEQLDLLKFSRPRVFPLTVFFGHELAIVHVEREGDNHYSLLYANVKTSRVNLFLGPSYTTGIFRNALFTKTDQRTGKLTLTSLYYDPDASQRPRLAYFISGKWIDILPTYPNVVQFRDNLPYRFEMKPGEFILGNFLGKNYRCTSPNRSGYAVEIDSEANLKNCGFSPSIKVSIGGIERKISQIQYLPDSPSGDSVLAIGFELNQDLAFRVSGCGGQRIEIGRNSHDSLTWGYFNQHHELIDEPYRTAYYPGQASDQKYQAALNAFAAWPVWRIYTGIKDCKLSAHVLTPIESLNQQRLLVKPGYEPSPEAIVKVCKKSGLDVAIPFSNSSYYATKATTLEKSENLYDIASSLSVFLSKGTIVELAIVKCASNTKFFDFLP